MEDDLDPFGLPASMAKNPSRPPGAAKDRRFRPNFKGAIKAEPSADLTVSDKQEDGGTSLVKGAEGTSQDPPNSVPEIDEPTSNPMEVDDDAPVEDIIVREIDVFFNPSLPVDAEEKEGTVLYVMQYPLRPSWRPYELDKRCEEVRVKPKQSSVEVDLNLDADSTNYDREVSSDSRIQKQILSSSKSPMSTNYAIGIMIENQIHLNPIHAIVQLRPQQGKIVPGKSNENTQDAEGKIVPGKSNENTQDAEPWVSLKYYQTGSDHSNTYRQEMVSQVNYHLPFTMKPSDYVKSVCRGRSTDNTPKGSSKRALSLMPMEERIKTWLTQNPVCNFVRFTHLAHDNTSEEILKVLQQYAVLVQGLWVCKSSLLYEGQEARARDYILCLFSKDRLIPRNKLKGLKLKVSESCLNTILSQLAVERSTLNDWKFKEDTDSLFEAQYPDIVEKQQHAWSNREKEIMNSLHSVGKPSLTKKPLVPNKAIKATVTGNLDPGVNRGNVTVSPTTTMSKEAREALPKALNKLFQLHKVCSLNSIARDLREMALQKSSLGKDDRETKTFVNAANCFSAHSPELKSVLSNIAVDIHGVYVLKPVGNSMPDLLRNVVINLFLKREPNAKIEKKEIEQAARTSIKRGITDSEYNQVLNELCVNSKGAWMLKRVD